MLDVEPPADLRARVTARINGPVGSGRFVASAFRRKAWLALPLAAAAVLILAVTLSRRSEPPAQPSRLASAADQNLPADAYPPIPAAPTPGSTIRTVSTPVHHVANTRRETVVAAAIDAGPDNATTDIEPLKTITPIHVAPIGERNIAPESIAVRPLNPISDVQVAPLTPPDRRN